MPIKRRKPYEPGQYVVPIATQRIKKLEAIKQQLLELDNRLKMEMFGLKELAGDPVDVDNIINLESEDDLLTSAPKLAQPVSVRTAFS